MRRSPPSWTRVIVHAPIALAALLGAAPARAEGTDVAAAQALFDQAKQLVAAGKLAEACPKFLASHKLDPKPGSAVNLADCYEKTGQTASAWARYLEAASLAQRSGQAEREQYAREHAATLEPRLSRMSIRAAAPPPGLQVTRDGTAVDPGVLGATVPVDPGKHVIEARAPRRAPWSTTVSAPPPGGTVSVEIPALAEVPEGTGDVAAAPTGGAAVPFWGTQRVAGAVVAALGLAGVATGAAFGGLAASRWSSAKRDHCGGTSACDPTGVSLAGEARTAATVSTATLLPGAAALVAGAVTFFTAPRPKSKPRVGLSASATPLPGGAALTLTGDL